MNLNSARLKAQTIMNNEQENSGNIQLFPDTPQEDKDHSLQTSSSMEVGSLYDSANDIVYDDFNPETKKLGITMASLSVFIICLSLSIFYSNLKAENFDLWVMIRTNPLFFALNLFFLISFGGLLAKQEWARKVVCVILSFSSHWLLRKLINKNFKRSSKN